MFRPPPLPRTFEAALRDVGSTKPAVRAEATRELVPHVATHRARVVGALEGLLRDPEARVRAVAATALADIEGREALPALLVALEDDDAEVRQMAIGALGEIGDTRTTERLRRALTDPRPDVRFQATMAFPRVCADESDAAEALIQATNDDDPLVVHIALRMAEEIAGERPLDPRLTRRAATLVEHGSGAVRIAAALITLRSGADPSAANARSVLVEAARGTTSSDDAEDVAAAIERCGELGLEQARIGLERRAFGSTFGLRRDPFAWHARVALARMGHGRAAKEIIAELGAFTRDQRTLAVAAAGRARLVAARPRIEAMRGDASRADADAVDEALRSLDLGASASP